MKRKGEAAEGWRMPKSHADLHHKLFRTMAKRVLITGANRGIGLAYAKHYKAKGWNVIGTVRDEAVARELRELNIEKIVTLNVTNEDSIREAANAVGCATPIDLLINNAGLLIADSIDTATKGDMISQFEINVVGPFLVSRAFLPNLCLATTGGKLAILANMTSRMGSIDDNSSGGYYGYRASKSALNAIGKSLAVDLEGEGICSVLLHPGYVITEMTGMRGELTPEQSVAGLTTVLNKVTMADNGKFYHSNGSLLPW